MSVIFLFFYLFSCANFPQPNEDVIGIYYSLSDKKYDYYFEIYSNKTFHQVLKNNDQVIESIFGTWRLIDKKGTLYLSRWIELDHGNIVLHPKGGTLLESNNILFFSSEDDNKNFKKAE